MARVAVLALVVAGLVPVLEVADVEPAAAATTTVPNGCRYSIDNKDRNVAVTLSGAATPLRAQPGEVVTLEGATLSAELPAWVPEYLYTGGLIGEGDQTVPATVWVAIEATNTVEGVQVVEVPVEAHTTITPPDPADPLSSVSATPLAVTNAVIGTTTWTPTGGSIELRQAGPGTLAGTSVGGVTPIGSVFLTTTLTSGLTSLTVQLDCRPGSVDVVNPPYAFTPAEEWDLFAVVEVPGGPVDETTVAPVAATASPRFAG